MSTKFSSNLSQLVNTMASIAKRERKEFVQLTLVKAELIVLLRDEWEKWAASVGAKTLMRQVKDQDGNLIGEFNIMGWKAFWNYLNAQKKAVCGYEQTTKYVAVFDNIHKILNSSALPEDKPLHKLNQSEWDSAMLYEYDDLFAIGATNLNKLAPAIKSDAVSSEDAKERYIQLKNAINPPKVNEVNSEASEDAEGTTEETEEKGFDTVTLKVGRNADGKPRSVVIKYRIEQFNGVDNLKRAIASAICTEMGPAEAIGAQNVQEILISHGVKQTAE